jgi:hypothetical protein
MLFDGALFPGNFTADSTIDEFYLWLDRSPAWNGGAWGLQTLWHRGRYYRPDDRDPGDARFTSGAIDLPPRAARVLPPPGDSPPPSRPPRLLGVAWTEWAEAYDEEGPKMLDHSDSPPRALRPEAGGFVDLYVEADGAWYGPYRDGGWSAARTPSGEAPAGSRLRYAAKLKMGGPASPGTILLASPVLDDVTLYFTRGGPEILGWVCP